MSEEKKPNIISTVNENNATYYFCDDGEIYKMDPEKTKLTKLGKEEKEKMISKYKENAEKQVDVSLGER